MATSKQCWYLAGLMEENGIDPADEGLGLIHTTAHLTKRDASAMIDALS